MPMVLKKCPSCSGGLPVACKSCSCGHVFLAKKPPAKPTDRKAEVLPGRLRPERPRRDILRHQEFLFQRNIKIEPGPMVYPAPTQPPQPPPLQMHTQQHIRVNQDGSVQPISMYGSHSIESAIPIPFSNPAEAADRPIPSRKRGRPKGSKDKKPRLPRGYRGSVYNYNFNRGDHFGLQMGQRHNGNIGDARETASARRASEHNDDDECHKGDHSDQDYFTHMTPEKRELFAMVLQDINAKIARQRFLIS